MNRTLFFAVPYSKNISSGPIVRVTSFMEAFNRYDNAEVIFGLGSYKLIKSIKAKKCDLLYVESSTNRVGLLDILSLLILRSKTKTLVVYIRDVYVEMFPEDYVSLRKAITKIINRLSNKFYGCIANKFAFPTKDMGGIFFVKNNLQERGCIELPPACDKKYQIASLEVSKKRNEVIKIIYIGGFDYKYSGIENFFALVKKSPQSFRFFIVTNDSYVRVLLGQLSMIDRKKIEVLSMNKHQLDSFIKVNNITFMYHCRPLNDYDGLTYPIKFFDALTWNLPILTSPHEPIKKILGNDYPFYVDVNDPLGICKIIVKNINNYFHTLKFLEKVAEKNGYDHRLTHLIKECE